MQDETLKKQLEELGIEEDDISPLISLIDEARERIKKLLSTFSQELPPESWIALDMGAQEIFEALTDLILKSTKIQDPHDHNEVYSKNEEARCKAMSIVLGVKVQTQRIDQITKKIEKQTREHKSPGSKSS